MIQHQGHTWQDIWIIVWRIYREICFHLPNASLSVSVQIVKAILVNVYNYETSRVYKTEPNATLVSPYIRNKDQLLHKIACVLHHSAILRYMPWAWHSFGTISFYRAFQGLGQAKFPDGGSILGLASKNNAWLKSGQNRPKNNHLA